MDLPTQTHLTTLRDALEFRQRELRADIHAAQLAQREPMAAAAREVGDRKDDAAQWQMQQTGDAGEQRDASELAQVEAALQRLDAGSYGDCADCSAPIPLQRLLAQPAAVRCAGCQAAYEHAPAQGRRRQAS